MRKYLFGFADGSSFTYNSKDDLLTVAKDIGIANSITVSNAVFYIKHLVFIKDVTDD